MTAAPRSTARTAPATPWWLLAGPVVVAALALAAITHADPDLWGHLRFGLDLARSWTLPAVDPYSFTQDRAWVNHEWLSELQMALAWMAAGTAGLALLKGLLALAAWWIVWRSLEDAAFEARVLVTAIAIVGTAQLISTLRPQLWSLVCLAVLCRALTDARGVGLFRLPVLFAIWANLHGGWVLGLGVLMLWAGADAVRRPASAPRWAWVVALCALATLVNPYGWHLWAFVGQTVRFGRPMIEEWQPVWTLPPDKWLVWIGAAIGVWFVLGRRAPGRLAPAFVLAVLAVASLRVARIVPLFVEAAAILLAPAVAARWPRPPRANVAVRTTADKVVVVLVAVVALAIAGVAGRRAASCIQIEDDPRMPEAAPVELLRGASPGRLVTFFNWGEYAIWHLSPDLRVSMDGRRETVYSDARLREHDAILSGSPEGIAALEGWQAEYVWLPAGSTGTRDWLLAHGYRLDFQSDRSFVAVRRDLPPLRSASGLPASAPCFPG
jgi:hypothetical protein